MRTGLAVAALLLASCTTPDPDGEGKIPLSEPHSNAAGAPGWLNPKTLELHLATREPEEEQMFIRGRITGWRFVPVGDVEGKIQPSPTGASTRPVWLRLLNRTIHPRTGGAKPPIPPHVPGRFDDGNGLFYPGQRAIVRGQSK